MNLPVSRTAPAGVLAVKVAPQARLAYLSLWKRVGEKETRITRNECRFWVGRLLLALVSVSAVIALLGCSADTTTSARQSRMGSAPMSGGDRGGMTEPGMRGHGMMMGSSMQRDHQAMMGGLPPAYRGLSNPLASNPQVISGGKALYQDNCAACHGGTGEGNGPAAGGMSPRPSNLRRVARRPMAGDGYLMWAISEGGTGLGTAMPAFKGKLSEAERWKIIRYLEALP